MNWFADSVNTEIDETTCLSLTKMDRVLPIGENVGEGTGPPFCLLVVCSFLMRIYILHLILMVTMDCKENW